MCTCVLFFAQGISFFCLLYKCKLFAVVVFKIWKKLKKAKTGVIPFYNYGQGCSDIVVFFQRALL